MHAYTLTATHAHTLAHLPIWTYKQCKSTTATTTTTLKKISLRFCASSDLVFIVSATSTVQIIFSCAWITSNRILRGKNLAKLKQNRIQLIQQRHQHWTNLRLFFPRRKTHWKSNYTIFIRNQISDWIYSYFEQHAISKEFWDVFNSCHRFSIRFYGLLYSHQSNFNHTALAFLIAVHAYWNEWKIP